MIDGVLELESNLLEKFISSIPSPDRQRAIEKATTSRLNLLSDVWLEEREKISEEFLEKYKLDLDINGWKKYLRLCYKQDSAKHKKHGFEDWSAKYLLQMLRNVLSVRNEIKDGLNKQSHKRSFYDRYFYPDSDDGLLFYQDVWEDSRVVPINPNSMLAHSIKEEDLLKSMQSGLLGVGGLAPVSFCQDRIVYDRGWVVVFQVKDLVSSGYPLIQVNEEEKDAQILQEWRSMPIDINLARSIVPTAQISDRNNASKSNIWGTSYFGENYLNLLARI